jgi:hypothetical protein
MAIYFLDNGYLSSKLTDMHNLTHILQSFVKTKDANTKQL